ncbi:MAG: ATP-binding protein, partial [Gemmatimonadota bacterium]|nr:ATP-binding protein [Gemmatimonadota bacterium]
RPDSLEHWLPAMISALLISTIAIFGLLAFTEVRRSSVAAATGQLHTLAGQIVDGQDRLANTRSSALLASVRNPVIARALANGPSRSDSAARRYLEARRNRGDTALLVSQLLVGADGVEHAIVGKLPTAVERAELAQLVQVLAGSDSVGSSEIFASDAEIHYWSVAPSRVNGKTLGYFAEQRRVRITPNVEQQLRQFTGQAMSVFFASESGKTWITLAGKATPARFNLTTLPDTFNVSTTDGEVVTGIKKTVKHSPWVFVFYLTDAAVGERARTFLWRMALAGALLLAIGIVGARLISRRVTQPLKSLTLAAREIANGNFTRRERVQTKDELGQLAQAFNSMAERIGQSHTELAQRMRESQALAQQLHERNDALETARQIATEARIASDHARAEAQNADKAKTEFLAMMSHELRTPLSAIAGYVELLQLGIRGELNDGQRRDLARIQANQAHLLRIINDMLDLAQVESGQMQIDSNPVTLGDVLGDVEPIILPIVESRNLTYIVSPDVESLTVIAERERLTQVLVNLVANAARFTEPGGNVSIHAQQTGGRIRLHVSDTGIGIPAAKQDAVFQPFIQVDSGASRRTQGTGLGLTISRRIVEAMNGTLTLASELGVGSTFTLEIPAASKSTISSESNENSHAANGSGTRRPPWAMRA